MRLLCIVDYSMYRNGMIGIGDEWSHFLCDIIVNCVPSIVTVFSLSQAAPSALTPYLCCVLSPHRVHRRRGSRDAADTYRKVLRQAVVGD